ncbi:MAG: DUF6731 family protein [Cetobacterium sp.]|uniref:DUF6731 family protein n=1 Tax=Cetobacterium sp. TaxID=2071632 RepID=UPI003EE62FA3
MANVNKKIRKRIGFNFYKAELKFEGKIIDGWDASEVFDYYIKNTDQRTHIDIGDEIVEIEPNSLLKAEKIYFFQLSNLRNDLIPAKKTLGQVKKELDLDDDEYIGEFTGIVYDSSNHTFMIQTNKYGVGIKQITEYLKKLREKCIKTIKIEEEFEEELKKELELNFVIDETKVNNIQNSKEIRKITFKSCSSVLATIEGINKKKSKENKTLSELQRMVESTGNIKFEIVMSADLEEPEDKRGSNLINKLNDLIQMCKLKKDKTNKLENEKLGLEVVRKEKEDSKVELVDFFAPKLIEYINISIEPKKSIGTDYLRTEMVKLYSTKKAIIDRILG